MTEEKDYEELWAQFLGEGVSFVEKQRALFRALPDDPRCMFCHSPFEGYGSHLMKLIGRDQSREDPRFCNACVKFGQEHPGGAYVDLAMLFADVRGSTPLAEKIGDREFSKLIAKFFRVSARSIINSGGLLDRLAGDEAIGFFVPGLAGENYPQKALESAMILLETTGHGSSDGPWVPLGVGVHLGNAYVGLVGASEGVANFTALGDDVNVGARIASAAGPGELLASLEFCQEAGLDVQEFEQRELSLKGKNDPVKVAAIPVEMAP